MTAIGRALMAKPSLVLLDEPSMGLAPLVVEEIFEIARDLNVKEGVAFLLAEQNTTVALRFADYGYVLENGRVVMDGAAKELAENEDVKEFYLGLSTAGRQSFRDVKHYRRENVGCPDAADGSASLRSLEARMRFSNFGVPRPQGRLPDLRPGHRRCSRR